MEGIGETVSSIVLRLRFATVGLRFALGVGVGSETAMLQYIVAAHLGFKGGSQLGGTLFVCMARLFYCAGIPLSCLLNSRRFLCHLAAA